MTVVLPKTPAPKRRKVVAATRFENLHDNEENEQPQHDANEERHPSRTGRAASRVGC